MKLRRRLAKKLKSIKGDRPQAEFSKRLGIGQASLNRILQAQQSVSLDLLETICNSLRIDVVELLADDSGTKQPDTGSNTKWAVVAGSPSGSRGIRQR